MNDNVLKNKKGAMPFWMIGGIILGLIGFGILVYFLYTAGLPGQSEKEVCYTSVVFRSSLPSFAESYVPLKCKTSKICLTNRAVGGTCPDFGDQKGVAVQKVNNLDDIQETIWRNTIDCWYMMGKGELSIFSQYWAQYGFATVYPSCVICSRIAFDKESFEENKNINLADIDLFEYGSNHNVPGKKVTYVQYISEGNTIELPDEVKFPEIQFNTDDKGEQSIAASGEANPVPDANLVKLTANDLERMKEEMKDKEIAIFFMQISAPGHGSVIWNSIKAVLGIGAAGTAIIGPKKTWTGVTTVTKLCTGSGAALAVCAGIAAFVVGTQQLVTWTNRNIAANYCGDLKTGGEERDGCSAVRTVNYNEQAIAEFCPVIESTG